jgi:hypothetical protein
MRVTKQQTKQINILVNNCLGNLRLSRLKVKRKGKLHPLTLIKAQNRSSYSPMFSLTSTLGGERSTPHHSGCTSGKEPRNRRLGGFPWPV